MMESAAVNIFSHLPTADSVFIFLLLTSILLFVGIEVVWTYQKYKDPLSVKVPKQHVDFFWSLIPALILILLTRVS